MAIFNSKLLVYQRVSQMVRGLCQAFPRPAESHQTFQLRMISSLSRDLNSPQVLLGETTCGEDSPHPTVEGCCLGNIWRNFSKPEAILNHGWTCTIVSFHPLISPTKCCCLGKKHMEQHTGKISCSVVFKEPRANKCRTYDPLDNTKNFQPLLWSSSTQAPTSGYKWGYDSKCPVICRHLVSGYISVWKVFQSLCLFVLVG